MIVVVVRSACRRNCPVCRSAVLSGVLSACRHRRYAPLPTICAGQASAASADNPHSPPQAAQTGSTGNGHARNGVLPVVPSVTIRGRVRRTWRAYANSCSIMKATRRPRRGNPHHTTAAGAAQGATQQQRATAPDSGQRGTTHSRAVPLTVAACHPQSRRATHSRAVPLAVRAVPLTVAPCHYSRAVPLTVAARPIRTTMCQRTRVSKTCSSLASALTQRGHVPGHRDVFEHAGQVIRARRQPVP